MKSRRDVIKLLAAFCAGAVTVFGRLENGLRVVYAATKRMVLPKGTPMRILTGRNPANLDARHLETTPLEQFGTMGQSNYSISTRIWRLEVIGAVRRPGKYTFEELAQRPKIERNVLLICPGFFAYYGRYQGISVADLLAEAGMKPEVTHIDFSGPNDLRRKTARFSLEEVLTNKVFLAYRVNGVPLPTRHGFPMRLVAEDHYGARWIKYVCTVSAVAR
jgi:sulfoxide reductase catalytic subunit YedY